MARSRVFKAASTARSPPLQPQLQPITRRAAIRGAASLGMLGIVESLLATPSYANALQIGELAPPATLVTADGARVDIGSLLGQVVILTFWATWWAPCREELPLLSAYAMQHAAQGLAVLGFSLDSPAELHQVEQVAWSLAFPVGLLARSRAPGYGRIWRIPVNFTIDRRGRLVDNGWHDKQPVWTRERLERIVTPLLEAAS